MTEYKPNARYFLEIPAVMLNTPLPGSIKKQLGYPKDAVFILGDAVNCLKFLASGNVAISIQITPYSNYSQGSSTVKNCITEDDFKTVKILFQTNTFLMLDEYADLVQLGNQII